MSLKFYLDDDSGMKPTIHGVRRLGIEINPSDDFGMRGAEDSVHLEFAASRGLVLVTANRGDFLRLHREWTLKVDDTRASSLCDRGRQLEIRFGDSRR